jgi:hypothetical protein
MNAYAIDSYAMDASEIDASEIDANEMDASELDASELASEMDASEMDASEMDASEIDSAWAKFCCDDDSPPLTMPEESTALLTGAGAPKCSPLNISTKTKISYLNYPIDLKTVFWAIPLIPYHEPHIGVIKKQMKFNSLTPEEVLDIGREKAKYTYVDDFIISQVPATDGRNKFKDIRKVSIGICKKDITSYRCKRKSAFYNCFVVILRLLHNESYKEIHVKVFNTGKLEIPGIQDATILDKVLALLVDILTPIVVLDATLPVLTFLGEKSETVMINSNFNCGYYINREKMYKVLKYKYKINSNFDPCSYPGIQCEFYHDTLLQIQCGVQPPLTKTEVRKNISKISFMIFRTGSVLIVGKCSEEMLYEIYEFLCQLFETEYDTIKGVNGLPKCKKEKDVKQRKIRKKTILMGGNPPGPPIAGILVRGVC